MKGIVFTVSAVSIKFDLNASADAGADAQGLGTNRAAYFVDDHVRHSAAGERALNSMRVAGHFDSFASLGGGWVIDPA